MGAKERLDRIQGILIERGVLDVKFSFDDNITDHSLDEVRLMLARVLESYAVGEYAQMQPIGDKEQGENYVYSGNTV